MENLFYLGWGGKFVVNEKGFVFVVLSGSQSTGNCCSIQLASGSVLEAGKERMGIRDFQDGSNNGVGTGIEKVSVFQSDECL